jgi:hypothetical protein
MRLRIADVAGGGFTDLTKYGTYGISGGIVVYNANTGQWILAVTAVSR